MVCYPAVLNVDHLRHHVANEKQDVKGKTRNALRPAQRFDLLRRSRLFAVPAQSLHQGQGLLRRRARPADHRRHRHLFGLQSLPRQRAAADRGGEARRDAGGRAADGIPDHLDPRELLGADLDVHAQPDVDRHRGDGARATDGRRGGDRGLRQDAAGAGDGCGLGRQARDRAADRPDGGRPLQGRGARGLHRLPPAVGAASRRQDGRSRDRGRERAARAIGRHLHGDGHREHDGLRDRGARLLAALCGSGARRACGARAHRRGERPPGGCDGESRQPEAARAVHRAELAQRADRAAGDRRLDQRHRASRRDGGARRHHARSRRVRCAVEAGAGADRPQAVGRSLHGALPSCRRRAAADAGIVRHPRSRCTDGRRHVARSCEGRRAGAGANGHPVAREIRSMRRARCACCAATSRRAAR